MRTSFNAVFICNAQQPFIFTFQDSNLMRSHMKIFLKSYKNRLTIQKKASRVLVIKKISLRDLRLYIISNFSYKKIKIKIQRTWAKMAFI